MIAKEILSLAKKWKIILNGTNQNERIRILKVLIAATQEYFSYQTIS